MAAQATLRASPAARGRLRVQAPLGLAAGGLHKTARPLASAATRLAPTAYFRDDGYRLRAAPLARAADPFFADVDRAFAEFDRLFDAEPLFRLPSAPRGARAAGPKVEFGERGLVITDAALAGVKKAEVEVEAVEEDGMAFLTYRVKPDADAEAAEAPGDRALLDAFAALKADDAAAPLDAAALKGKLEEIRALAAEKDAEARAAKAGRFERAYKLRVPDGYDLERVAANLDEAKGELTIEVPEKAPVTRRIAIE